MLNFNKHAPTIIVRVITDDYIKVSGNAITDTTDFSVNKVFKGETAKQDAIDWIDSNQERVKEGLIETRFIVKGDLHNQTAKPCYLTQALYGTPI